MGTVQAPQPAALIAGIFYADSNVHVYEKAMKRLADKYGPLEIEGPSFRFDMTDYYTGEMGAGLVKRFVCFSRPIPLESLSGIKLFTNGVENDLADVDDERMARRINIDPGYVTLSKLVLATTKDYSHRIYIGEGIFAEVTLRFAGGTFNAHDTTFPDYQTPLAIDFFNTVRDFVKRNRYQWTSESVSKS